MLVATPINAAERSTIVKGEFWHFSKATPKQVTITKLNSTAGGPNAQVRLSPPTGWQLDFWKFIRDLVVWDPRSMAEMDRGRYLYGFLGEPSAWTRRVNVQNAPLTIRVRGADLLANVPNQNLFYRPLDHVLVIKGDYVGPALLAPPP